MKNKKIKKREAYSGVLGTPQKLLARKNAQTLFRGIWTNGVKVMEFQSFY